MAVTFGLLILVSCLTRLSVLIGLICTQVDAVKRRDQVSNSTSPPSLAPLAGTLGRPRRGINLVDFIELEVSVKNLWELGDVHAGAVNLWDIVDSEGS